MRSVIEAVLTIFFSLILGAVSLALCAFYAPDFLEALQINAGFFKEDLLAILTSFGTQSNVNVWIRFLVQDEQLVFMGFVIVSRVVLSLFFWGLRGLGDMVMGR